VRARIIFTHRGGWLAPDYVLWRKGLGSAYTQSDYNNLWRTNFGKVLGTGLEIDSTLEVAVPEPVTVMLALLGFVGTTLQYGRRTRINRSVSE
jgi:hypothetical protein